jgi:hypothetical protein
MIDNEVGAIGLALWSKSAKVKMKVGTLFFGFHRPNS